MWPCNQLNTYNLSYIVAKHKQSNNDRVHSMKPEIIAIFIIFTVFALLEAFHNGLLNKKNEVKGVLSYTVCSYLIPDLNNYLSGINVLLAFGLFLIFDDMTQYWWHRITHSVPWLYNLHRPHHNAEYLSMRVVYRNNIFYYFLMPSIWLSGILIYLGLVKVYAVFIIIKMLVIVGAHSDVRWDEPLYKIKWMSPIMWVVERTISTPATHSAHHGKHASDGITNYKGNFGNLLFFWDVLFGTAKITRKYPSEFGVENLPETTVGEQLFWPIIKAKK